MQDAAAPYLTTSDLSVGYRVKRRESRLFENLNLSLPAGNLICFMGPNGTGKSSLIRTLAGLQQQLSGRINTHVPVESFPRLISVVLTTKISSVNLTGYDVITYGRYPYLNWSLTLTEHDRNIIANAIEMVRVEHLLEKKLFEMSDGQIQMVMIARALAQDTPIILLDEPTAHLDLNNRVEIMKLLLNLSRTTHKAILVATHELDLALQMADLIWLAGRNKNIHTGIPEDLVLDGSFDNIFQLKGFDLRTGKVQHQPYRKIKVNLQGEGFEFLWTKNALERNGFEVTQDATPVRIKIERHPEGMRWVIDKDGRETIAESVGHAIDSI